MLNNKWFRIGYNVAMASIVTILLWSSLTIKNPYVLVGTWIVTALICVWWACTHQDF